MTLTRYTAERAEQWNEFVARAKNGTFMLQRNYMDYHSARFEDCSLMLEDKGRIFSVFPANMMVEERCVYSHQGLTYGGLLMSDEMDTARVVEGMKKVVDYYWRELGAERMVYKAVPYIYWSQPSQEDEYVLWRMGTRLRACGLSSCVNLREPIGYRYSRKYELNRARKAGLWVELTEDAEEYWQILNNVLQKRHNRRPVHSSEEMKLLMGRFPQNIKLWVSRANDGRMLAGAWIYIYNNVVHTQYLATNAEGRGCGALDMVIDRLIHEYAPTHQWLDFGISTEEDGRLLNEGLVQQKEGFGGRGVCYNVYELDLRNSLL